MEEMTLGPWAFVAHIESRPQFRLSALEPAVERGDLWYRIVLGIGYDDDTGERGVFGELSTAWLESPEEAAKQAKTLVGLVVSWETLDEEADDYVEQRGEAKFEKLYDDALARFYVVNPAARPEEA